MPLTDADLFARLDALGIRTRTVRHPRVFTVAEAKAHRVELPGAHTKNLFLKDRKGVLWLIVTDEDRPLDLKRLGRQIGSAPLSFGRPDLLEDVLGVAPGSVTPFAVVNDSGGRVRLVLDAALLRADALHVHPLDNSATTAIAPNDLMRFLGECGHEPLIVDLDA